MASSNVNTINIRGNNNNASTNNVSSASPSSLLTSTNGIRNDLISRNLYTPNRIYPITEKNQLQNILNSVSGIISLITPFKSFDLKNSVFARLVTSDTPLSEIGLAMLGNQMALNAASYISKQALPTIKVANLFDGSKNTKLFTPNINFTITKTGAITNFQQFLDAVTFFTSPERTYPFTPSSTNADYIEKTGTGQLTFLYTATNLNLYKEGFSTSYNDIILTQSSEEAQIPLTRRNAIIGSYDNPLLQYKNYFGFFNGNPYSDIRPNTSSVNQANGDMVVAMNNSYVDGIASNTQEYAPNADYVEKVFGQTNINDKDIQISQNSNSWVNETDEFNDNSANKIVWGRDGVAGNADKNINNLRGDFNNANTAVTPIDFPNDKFNAYSGLLEYTRNLLNASEGAVVDITRKAFLKGKNVVGFNGSALWVANTSNYAINSGTDDNTGVRQHSSLDQYDRFAKAIRFNGNSVYAGNPNSVIYDRVLPRIHPTTPLDTNGVPNNRNLMFSIENLAVRVISSNDGIGIIDDEYGSQIPICEVGQFNGRQMWFPPYNLELNETSQAKFEPTVMVGRNEPMYSYMYSERSATLTFTLLVDYPPQLKNQNYQGTNKHRDIAEFFAFGGDPYALFPTIANTNQKVAQNQQSINTITGPTSTAEPDLILPAETKAVFPNDMPWDDSEVSNIIDTMYLTYQYQIEDGSVQSNGVQSSGFNDEIYLVTGMTTTRPYTLDPTLLPLGFSQYHVASLESPLNEKLSYMYKNPANRSLYAINIVGAASKLNDNKPNYNNNLGLRRANAIKYLIQQRLQALFPGEDISEIKINTATVGASGADPANSSGTQAEIDAKMEQNATVLERYANITFVRTTQTTPVKTPSLSQQDIGNINLLVNDNLALNKVGAKQSSRNVSQCVYNERKGDVINDSGDGGILKGFQAISGNYYYPVFHSQTPEDFHKRLTFLQQCLRQGAAKRYNASTTNNDITGNISARNSVFGRQPICVLRIGDFFFTKVIIENLNIDYVETTWDMNPEGFGMQPMIAKVTLQMKVIGGQSLKGPIDALQNAITFNYYANSNFTNQGMYKRPSAEADNQEQYMAGILAAEKTALTKAYGQKMATFVNAGIAGGVGH